MKVNYKKEYLKLKSICKEQGLIVKEVSDSVTEDYIGMNDEAMEAFGGKFPKDTFYIDSNLSYEAKYHTLHHEMLERDSMSKGKGYWAAHTNALKHEKELV